MGKFFIGGTFQETGKEHIRKAAALYPRVEPPELFFIRIYGCGQHHEVIEILRVKQGDLPRDRCTIRTAHDYARFVRTVEAQRLMDDLRLRGDGGNSLFLPLKRDL